jgi:hypothetical protein
MSKERDEAIYLAGFNASRDGWNGEYPFQDQGWNPERDETWLAARSNDLAAPALQGEPSELSDAEICQLADRHLRGTGPHCIINFARALLSRRTVPDAAPDQDKRDAIDDVPVAWMTDETPPRVCSDYSKNSSMARTTQASYCIPLYRKAANE